MDLYTLNDDKNYMIVALSKITRVSVNYVDTKQVIILHDNGATTCINHESTEEAHKTCNILFKGMRDVKSN